MFVVLNLKNKNHLKDLVVDEDNIKMYLKKILWFRLGVNYALCLWCCTFGFYKMLLNWLAEQLLDSKDSMELAYLFKDSLIISEAVLRHCPDIFLEELKETTI
jgi:hypothetical protein